MAAGKFKLADGAEARACMWGGYLRRATARVPPTITTEHEACNNTKLSQEVHQEIRVIKKASEHEQG